METMAEQVFPGLNILQSHL